MSCSPTPDPTAPHAPQVVPYLLGPTTHGLIVAWEAAGGQDWRVEVDDPAAQVSAPTFTEHADGDGGVYHVTLSALRDDHELGYRLLWRASAPHQRSTVTSSPGEDQPGRQGQWREAARGRVRVPAASRERTRLLVMSDTHAFNLREDMCRLAASCGADLALHLGDIPAGTGVQKEQYQHGWLEAFAPVLSHLPFIYAPGNHDDGPHLDTYVGAQASAYRHDASGRCLSLDDPSGLHLVVLDSNPWGLTEMNAVASGVPVPPEVAAQIEQTEQWLAADLASPEARAASWRVVVMHHPYSDRLTNQRLAELLEAGGVDLVLSGHLHHYDKAVPVATGPVPRPVYLTLPSCQDPAGGLVRTREGERLMAELPEVVAHGNGTYTLLEASRQTLTATVYAVTAPGAAPQDTDTVVLSAHDRPEDLVVRDVAWEEVAPGVLQASATAENTGRGLLALTPTLTDNGTPVTVRLLGPADARGALQSLDAGERAQVHLTYRPGPGRHVVELAGVRTTLVVPEPDGLSWTAPVLTVDREASTLTYSADLLNPTAGTLHVRLALTWDGAELVSRELSLTAGASQSARLTASFPQGGTHTVALTAQSRPDDGDPTSARSAAPALTLEERDLDAGGGIGVVPRVRDRSGWGNHALVRGCPRLVSDDAGRPALALERDGDYLEIPPSASLPCTDALAARVHARVDRLAHAGEMAHNPLLQRGLSVGWGATYHLRMVIDRNGTMKWGSCHGATEYGWAGGRAQVGRWADYEMRLGADGGCSLVDGQQTASVPEPGAHLSDYSSQPLFVGYSYIGHVIEQIGRPKYYTHLPAAVSQVRYAVDAHACLDPAGMPTGEEGPAGASSQADPAQRVAGAAGLQEGGAVRVDLDLADIATTGRYVSAWRQVRRHQPDFLRDIETWQVVAVRARAQVPAGCQVRLRVESSLSRLRATGRASLDVTDGTSRTELPHLEGAWFRLVCELSGVAEPGEPVRSPLLEEVVLEAVRRDGGRQVSAQLAWSTPQQWARGECDGAVGPWPVDRLHVFDEFTDPIHG